MPAASMLGLTLLLQCVWSASAATCSSADYDCATCVGLTESDCYFDCQCSFCASSGACTAALTAVCSPEDTWINSAASCPAAQPACSGNVCEEERFKGGHMLPAGVHPSMLQHKACCEHGAIVVTGGHPSQATCSFPQDCSLTCSRNMHPSDAGPDATCVCDDGWYGLEHQCSTHCTDERECGGHGTCGQDGKCQCDEGWWTDDRRPDNTLQCSLHCGPHATAIHGHCVCDNHFWPEWRDPSDARGPGCSAYCDPSISCSGNGVCDRDGLCVCTRQDPNGRNYTSAGTWHEDKQEWINCSKLAPGGSRAPAAPSSVGMSSPDSNTFGHIAKKVFKVMLGGIMMGCLCTVFCMCCSQRRDKRRPAVDLDESLASGADSAGGVAENERAARIPAEDLSSSFMARAQFGAYGAEVRFPRCETLPQLLETLGLSAYAQALAGLGVQAIEHLADLSVDDLQACGISLAAQAQLQSYWACHPPMAMAGANRSTLGGLE